MRYLSGLIAGFAVGTCLITAQPGSASPIAASVLPSIESNLVRVDDGICGEQCQAERWQRYRYGYRQDNGVCEYDCQAERWQRQRYGYRQDNGVCEYDCQAERRWHRQHAYRQDNGVCEYDCQAERRWRRQQAYGSYGYTDAPWWQQRPRWHYRVYEGY